jgi:hypothetical protein
MKAGECETLFVNDAYSLVFEGCKILIMLCHYPRGQAFRAPGG